MFHPSARVLAICALPWLTACDSAMTPLAPSDVLPTTAAPGSPASGPSTAPVDQPASLLRKPPADGPIVVQRGELDLPDTAGTLSLYGNRGFSLVGRVSTVGGNVPQCSFGCAPGGSIPLLALWVGNDLPVTVTLEGATYSLGGATGPFGTVQFDGSAVAPPFTARGRATVKAPFTLTGEFVLDEGDGMLVRVPFTGEGVATVWLSAIPGGSSWSVDRVVYRMKHAS
jgi:hypothetical protein